MMIPETIADLLAANHNQEWQRDALCAQVDHDLFFPDPCGSAAAAKRICQGCDVKTECLQYALDNHINHGVWGGLSDRERRTLHPQTAGGLERDRLVVPAQGRTGRRNHPPDHGRGHRRAGRGTNGGVTADGVARPGQAHSSHPTARNSLTGTIEEQ